MRLNGCNQNYDVQEAVYTGQSLTELVRIPTSYDNNWNPGCYEFSEQVAVTEGVTYYIALYDQYGFGGPLGYYWQLDLPEGISGVVRDQTSGKPIPGICVAASDGTSTLTSPTGAYALILQPGSYQVNFGDCILPDGVKIPRYRQAYWNPNGSRDAPGTAIDVQPNAISSDHNIRLVPAGAISGVLRDARHSEPVVGACVHALNRSGRESGFALTSQTGSYRIVGLARGDYRVLFDDCFAPNVNGHGVARFVRRYYTLGDGDAIWVAVRRGVITEGINQRVDLGRTISGSVRAPESGERIGAVCVTVYASSGEAVAAGYSYTTADYRISGLPDDHGKGFVVGFDDCQRTPTDWLSQYYRDATTFERARRVVTTAHRETRHIDVILRTSHIPPANDNFEHALVLSGDAGAVDGTNRWATAQSGEPHHGTNGGGPNQSVWYRYTASANGTLDVNFCNANFYAIGGIYTGTEILGLHSAATPSFPECDLRARVHTGTTYFIAVDVAFGQGGEFSAYWNLGVPPPNDDFVNAEALVGTSGSVYASVDNATAEPGEPDHTGYLGTANQSIWYRVDPVTDGVLSLDLCNSFGSAVFAVYTGTAVDALTNVNPAPRNCSQSFDVAAGETYWIAFDIFPGSYTNFVFDWAIGQRPANDNFVHATALMGTNGTTSGSVQFSSSEAGEPAHGYGWSPTGSNWYSVTPSASGVLAVDTCGQFDNAFVDVYTGTAVDSLTRVDLGWPGYPNCAQTEIPVVAGTTYWVSVINPGSGYELGHYVLTWSLDHAVANDNFVNAELIAGNRGTLVGSTLFATSEPGEPNHSLFGPAAHSVWFQFVPSSDGVFQTGCNQFNNSKATAVYSGASIDHLTRLGGSPFSCGSPAIPMRAGTTYSIAVDDGRQYYGQGNFEMPWQFGSVPSNNDFANAIALHGLSGNIDGTTFAADSEAGEPTFEGSASTVWYSYTPSSSGSLTLTQCAPFGSNAIAVYSGPAVDQLNIEGYLYSDCSTPANPVDLFAGKTYWIQISSYGFGTDFNLGWTFA